MIIWSKVYFAALCRHRLWRSAYRIYKWVEYGEHTPYENEGTELYRWTLNKYREATKDLFSIYCRSKIKGV